RVEPGEKGVTIDAVSSGASGRGRGGRNRNNTEAPNAAPATPGQPGQPAQGRGPGGPVALPLNEAIVEVDSKNPDQDAERLLRAFMGRAYRRPVQENEVQRYLGLIRDRMKKG